MDRIGTSRQILKVVDADGPRAVELQVEVKRARCSVDEGLAFAGALADVERHATRAIADLDGRVRILGLPGKRHAGELRGTRKEDGRELSAPVN